MCGKLTISKYLMFMCNTINVLFGVSYCVHCIVYYIHKLPLQIVAEVLVLLYLDLFMSCKLFYYYLYYHYNYVITVGKILPRKAHMHGAVRK